MKLILEEGSKYIIRLDKDEELIQSLADFCEQEEIGAGHFTAIGLASEVILSYYNIQRKQYEDSEIKENLEVTGLIGNVAVKGYETIIHCHGTFSDLRMNVIGGHVKKMVVAATCEVVLEKFKGKVERVPDSETGLNLMQ